MSSNVPVSSGLAAGCNNTRTNQDEISHGHAVQAEPTLSPYFNAHAGQPATMNPSFTAIPSRPADDFRDSTATKFKVAGFLVHLFIGLSVSLLLLNLRYFCSAQPQSKTQWECKPKKSFRLWPWVEDAALIMNLVAAMQFLYKIWSYVGFQSPGYLRGATRDESSSTHLASLMRWLLSHIFLSILMCGIGICFNNYSNMSDIYGWITLFVVGCFVQGFNQSTTSNL